MFVPFTLFLVDRHLKKLDNHSLHSVEQIGSDYTRIDLRASVFFFKNFLGEACPRTPLTSAGFACTFELCAQHRVGQPPWSKTSSYASDSVFPLLLDVLTLALAVCTSCLWAEFLHKRKQKSTLWTSTGLLHNLQCSKPTLQTSTGLLY